MGTVYIVHCIDTEGPLYEPIEETFQRIRDIFGITVPCSEDNLRKLRQKQIPLDGLEQPVADLIAPQLIQTLGTWDQIDSMLARITSQDFRNTLPDSAGAGWIYNWFCIDHVGFTGANPRRRSAGPHVIFDHYQRLATERPSRDLVQWHYHPLPFTGHFHGSGLAYLNSSNIWDVLSRKVIDRLWFPAAFRPGFHAERPDSHWFLEQWIPFDYANQSTVARDTSQPDLAGGRWGDWRRAPLGWTPYHPSHDDYQRPGNCRRWIARCLNMRARLRQLEAEDVVQAFQQASDGQDAILAFTDHDFRNMAPEIERVREFIARAARQFPKVAFFYKNAVDAFRSYLGVSPKSVGLSADIQYHESLKSAVLSVRTVDPPFGPQPYLAMKEKTGTYVWENFDFQDDNTWTFTFDANHMPLGSIEKIGIAVNSRSGVADVMTVDLPEGRTRRRTLDCTASLHAES